MNDAGVASRHRFSVRCRRKPAGRSASAALRQQSQPPHHEDPRISISSISGRARAPALPVAALTGSAGEPGGNATRVFQAGARSTPLTRHLPDGEGTETPLEADGQLDDWQCCRRIKQEMSKVAIATVTHRA